MTFPNSGFFVASMVDKFDTTQLAIDLDLETAKVALWTDTGTYDLVTDQSYNVAPWNANECSGSGYSAGGTVLTTSVYTAGAAGATTWGAANTSWAGATISSIYGCMIHADYLTPKRGIIAVKFSGSPYSVTAGTLTIAWSGGAVATIDWIP